MRCGARDDVLAFGLGFGGVAVRVAVGGLLGVGALVRDESVGGLAGAVGDVLGQDVLGRLVVGVSGGRVAVLLGNFEAVVVRDAGGGAGVERVLGVDFAVHCLLVDDAAGGDLAKHLERVEPGVDRLQADFVVDGGDGHALDVDWAAVRFSSDFLSFAVM